jgi:hypothetical protein
VEPVVVLLALWRVYITRDKECLVALALDRVGWDTVTL